MTKENQEESQEEKHEERQGEHSPSISDASEALAKINGQTWGQGSSV